MWLTKHLPLQSILHKSLQLQLEYPGNEIRVISRPFARRRFSLISFQFGLQVNVMKRSRRLNLVERAMVSW